VALAPPAALAVGTALKRIASRPRPWRTRFRRKGMQSFPSTHVAGPAALVGCLLYTAPDTPRWRAALAIGTTLVLALAVERVCAGAHWPSDVLAGGALGLAVGVAVGHRRSP
jgi:membrane-associated phospholipid phosphatase